MLSRAKVATLFLFAHNVSMLCVFGEILSIKQFYEADSRTGFDINMATKCAILCESNVECVGVNLGENSTECHVLTQANITMGWPGFTLKMRDSCPSDWYHFDRSCYQISTHMANWNDAASSCVNQGGNLTSITSPKEKDFLYQLKIFLDCTEHLWIGGYEITEGDWRWVSGEPWSYAPYVPGQPDNYMLNENCIDLQGYSNLFNDNNCALEYAFICEVDVG